ncbi:hypothetical protein BKA61DRAFT_607534 [Leptodontidium sp. MPI-SDFR-AT-0119]|nr:hypothetical protein BKA61DRAFT_607534 [Leptodontidium sp. MPI-SDFR-AT-0119]
MADMQLDSRPMASDQAHDETLRSCYCRAKPVKILLIGRTQHGKSSLVKSILSYGGYNELSKQVKRGNNNVSQTQTVTTYRKNISLKSHHLRNKEGRELRFSSNQVSQLEGPGVNHFLLPSGRHVHLTLLDTPGLGDSNNYKAAAATFKHKSIAELSTIKLVDEQHKLAIMEQLLHEGEIHGVCFVVKWGEPFSDSLQKDIKAYRQIFEDSRMKTVNYFVLHTSVLPSNRSDDAIDERKREFTNHFAFPVKHHFLDSDPDPDIPLEVYLSQFHLDNLLNSFRDSKPCPVTDLTYTKSAPQQNLDANFRDLFGEENITKIIIAEIESLENDLEKARLQVRNNQNQLQKSRERMEEKEKEIAELDKPDHEMIGKPFQLSETWLWFRKTTISFDIPTSTIIRDWTLDPPQGEDGPWSDQTGKGTYQFHALLTGDTQSAVSGTVTLKGMKREIFAAEISQHREELETHKDTITSLTDRSKILSDAKTTLESNLEALQDMKKGVLQDINRISHRGVSLKNAKKDIIYLTICNPIGMSFAYGLRQELPKKYLPPNITSPASSLAELRRQRARWDSMLRFVQKVLRAFECDDKRKVPILQGLKKFQDQVKEARNWTDAKLSTRPRLEVGVLAAAYKPYLDPEIRQGLESLEQELVSRGDQLDERLQELREMESYFLTELVRDIEESIADMKKLIANNKAERKEWETYRQICETTRAAFDETDRLCRSETLPLGAIYIMYKTLISDGSRGIDPYGRLFDDILAAYHLRDSGDIMVLQRELDKTG